MRLPQRNPAALDRQAVPADLLLLCTSSPEGAAYVETRNLDGESHLKLKRAVEATAAAGLSGAAGLAAAVHCEAPNANLYAFQVRQSRTIHPTPPMVHPTPPAV